MIIFAVLNFIITVLPCIMLTGPLVSFSNNIPDDKYDGYYSGFYDYERQFSTSLTLAFMLAILAAIVSIVMFTVISAKSYKFYHDRAVMDTLGCLPLSYRDRFWGDYFSGFCANMISFIPFAAISFIFTTFMNGPARKLKDVTSVGTVAYYLPKYMRKILISLLIIYISIHAVTTFVTSCCGKLGSSVIFSFVAMFIMPGLFVSYGMCGFSAVLGIDVTDTIAERSGMFPPFGLLISKILRYFGKENRDGIDLFKMSFSIESLGNVIAMILITAAFIVGAYFVGKYRKAENAEQSFVYGGVYHVISLTLIAMIIGFMVYLFPSESGELDSQTILKAGALSFFVYVALELSNKKGIKDFWKTILRYAGVFAASFGLIFIMKSTDGFGVWRNVPSADKVSEVRVKGDYFFSEFGAMYQEEYIYRAKESVSGIIEEHKALLEHSDELYTGEMLLITYKMSNGSEIVRHYSCKRDDENIIKTTSKNIKKLPAFKQGSLGFLDDPFYDDLVITFDGFKNFSYSGQIRADKAEEFVKLLKYDIENNFFADAYETGKEIIGNVNFSVNGNSVDYYRILTSYKDTLAFLNDPDNYTYNSEEKEAKKYHIQYYDQEDQFDMLQSVDLIVSEDDTSDAAKELLSYIEIQEKDDAQPDKYSKYFVVYEVTYYRNHYGIKKENEEAAVKALLKLFREKCAAQPGETE